MNLIKKLIKASFDALGLEIRRKIKLDRTPVELTKEEIEIISYVRRNNLSMASDESLWTTLMTCKYVIDQNIEGDFVECGVWRGGNALIAASVFKLYGVSKKVYLYDTFEGMTMPTEKDRYSSSNQLALDQFLENQKNTYNEWCYVSLEDVRLNFQKTGLINENVIFVKGDVCKTLNLQKDIPNAISVLRLDTDWYESTKIELKILYPRLSIGGCLIIDDYGHWAGARAATDDYFAKQNNRPFLQYIDYTARIAVKRC